MTKFGHTPSVVSWSEVTPKENARFSGTARSKAANNVLVARLLPIPLPRYDPAAGLPLTVSFHGAYPIIPPARQVKSEISPAWGADVVSSNIVGYTKITVPKGLSIIGQQFDAVGGGTNDVANVTSVEGLSPWGEDSVRFWNGASYQNLYYYAYDADEGSEGLLDTGEDGWGDADQKSVVLSVAPGTGFWINTSGEATVCTSGEVSSQNTVSIQPGLSLVCNPQPVAIDIQQIEAVGLSPWGEDSIRIWNGSSYANYYYYAYDAEEGSEGLLDTEKDGWGDADQKSVSVQINNGQGFWIQSGASATLSFPNAIQ